MAKERQILKNTFFLTFSLAAAYFCTGYLSNFLLAIDGYAVASWPPSGIALAGLLLFGYRAALGVFIGAILTNLIHLNSVSDILQWHVFLQAICVSFAALLQALVGRYFIVKVIQAPLDLSSLKRSVQSLIVAGPVSCVIAAAIGTSLLMINQVIPAHAALNNFITWWIGDSIGVLIFTPLLLAAFNYERARHRLQVIVPAIIIYAVISVSFYAAASLKKDKDIQKEEAKLAEVQSEINYKINEITGHLTLLSTFFASSNEVGPVEFERFTSKLLEFNKEILAFKWVQLVEINQVEQFEKTLATISPAAFIKEKSPQMFWQKALTRPTYYPVHYVQPLHNNEELIGFDMGSDETRRDALLMSKALNELVITKPVQHSHYGNVVLFFIPVFGDLDTLSDYKGHVVGVVSLTEFVGRLQFDHYEQVSANFYDVTDSKKNIIYEDSANKLNILKEYQLLIGKRLWQVELVAPKNQSSWLPYWLAQILGMLFVWLLITFLISVTGTNIHVREQVARQTRILREEKQKADEASQIKSQFLANMSHEVRTPINGIKGLHYLALQQDNWEQARHYIEQADGALNVLLRVLNDVLDFSKMEAGKLDLMQEPISINQLIDEIFNLVQFDAGVKSLAVNLQLDKDAELTLNTDPIRLKQVLLNLLNNAIKFTASGTITIKVWQQAQNTFFSVKDTGIGISPSAQQQLFQPFAQADSSTSRKFGGTGLGLSICKKLVEMMGGEISLHSEEGRGAKFTFSLPNNSPLPKAENFQPIYNNLDVGSLSFADTRVLLVEDNPLNQHVASAILKTKGCEIDIANDGYEAIEKVTLSKYDLVLMDIQMPNMDGLEATQVIRNELGMTELPIIGLSANAHDEDINKALNMGMDGYLTKPIEADKLFKTIWHYIPKPPQDA